jgi:superoxide reductase
MTSRQKFFRCEHCGNMIGLIDDNGAPLVCCGDEMTELVPNSTGASTEKHLPVVTVEGGVVSVSVGSAAHPMEVDHHISFVYLETKLGGQRKNLNVGEAPAVKFALVDDAPVAVYAYCNLHGIWKTEV